MIFTFQVSVANAGMACPNLTDEASKILDSISGLRDQIKNAPECTSIKDKLKNIDDILNNKSWGKVRDVLNGKTDVDLSTGEIDQIAKLVGTASGNITELISSLKPTGEKCVDPDQKSSFLSRLSTITKEVSRIVGGLSGPYGVAITLGGATLSSALAGIDSVFQARSYDWIPFYGKNDFDYTDSNDETLFMNQFCAFTEVQKEVNEYLNMPAHKQELEALEKYLEVKVEDIKLGCKECYELAELRSVDHGVDTLLESRSESASLVEMDSFGKCMMVADLAIDPNSEYNTILATLETFNPENMTVHHRTRYEAVMKAFANLKSNFPTFDQCLGLTGEVIDETQLGIYDQFIERVLIPTKNLVFTQERERLTERTNEMYHENLGAMTLYDLDVLDWLDPQMQLAERALQDGNYKLSSAKVERALRGLEIRIMDELMPEYLGHLGGRNLREINGLVAREWEYRRAMRSFVGLYKSQQKDQVLNRADRRQLLRMTDAQVESFINQQADFDTRAVQAELSRLLRELRTALQSSYAFGQYCEYIRYTNNGSIGIEQICSRYVRQITEAYERLIVAVPDFSEFIDFDNLFPAPVGLQSDNKVEEFNKLLENWEEKQSELYIKLDMQ